MIEEGAIKKTNLSDELNDKRSRQKGSESGQSERGDLWTGKKWSVPIWERAIEVTGRASAHSQPTQRAQSPAETCSRLWDPWKVCDASQIISTARTPINPGMPSRSWPLPRCLSRCVTVKMLSLYLLPRLLPTSLKAFALKVPLFNLSLSWCSFSSLINILNFPPP